MRSLPFTTTATKANLIHRVNAGEVTSAPPKTVPSGVVTVDQAVSSVIPGDAPPAILGLLKRYSWLPWAVLAIAIVLAIVLFFVFDPVAGAAVASTVAGGGIYLLLLLRQ
jgi:hypothetical protein